MKICIIGKYPPIEGGVSAQTFWLAHGLAGRGHQIHIVTNADEVEDFYRLTLMSDDGSWRQAKFDNGGEVRVYNAEAFSHVRMGHIPRSNPFVTKLAALAADVIRDEQCEAILAYYFEPYGVAGWLASRWTDRPLLIKHAGSDLDRLFRVPDLATSYREILISADAVVTQSRLVPRFMGLGVSRHKLRPDIAYGLPREVFNPEREPLNLAAITLDSHAALSEAPVIGVYGKVGVTKGTFDLIETLGGLAAQGVKFTFAAMIGDAQRQSIAQALARAGIESRTMVLPMLPIWRVPAFLRACTAVCFLERNFPIAIHGPIIPREVLACGTCLILSQEIAAKQRYGDRLADKENVLIVPDPKDHAGLSAALRVILEDPERAAEIGAQGAELSRSLENYEAFVLGWESLFAGCATSRDRVQDSSLPSVAHADIVALMPDLYAFLKRVCPQRIVAFQGAGSPTEPFDAAIALCYFVAAGLEDSLDSTLLPRVHAALAYARARLIVGHIPKTDRNPIFPVGDRLLGRPATLDAIGRLRPVRGSGVRIEAFDFDVSKVRMLLTVGGLPPNDDDGADLAELEPKATLVLFNRAPNLSPCELRIDAATRRLVETCDGHLTTNELIAEMCGYFCAVSQAQRDEVGTELCQALDRLYQSGVIVFGDYRPGWGWLGGARGRETIPPRSPN